MQLIRQIANMANHAASLAGNVRELLARHQVLSRMVWLGVGPTAVLVVMELSNYFLERAG